MQLSFSGPKTWELESTYYIFLQIVCYLSMWIECNFHIYCQAPGQAQGPDSKKDGPWSDTIIKKANSPQLFEDEY